MAQSSCISNLPLRERADEPNNQPEALCIVVVDYDGQNPARLITDQPAPQPAELTHIGAFYERISRLYSQRF